MACTCCSRRLSLPAQAGYQLTGSPVTSNQQPATSYQQPACQFPSCGCRGCRCRCRCRCHAPQLASGQPPLGLWWRCCSQLLLVFATEWNGIWVKVQLNVLKHPQCCSLTFSSHTHTLALWFAWELHSGIFYVLRYVLRAPLSECVCVLQDFYVTYSQLVFL